MMTELWAMSGDCLSKIYAGTRSVLIHVTTKGKESVIDKVCHKYYSAKR